MCVAFGRRLRARVCLLRGGSPSWTLSMVSIDKSSLQHTTGHRGPPDTRVQLTSSQANQHRHTGEGRRGVHG